LIWVVVVVGGRRLLNILMGGRASYKSLVTSELGAIYGRYSMNQPKTNKIKTRNELHYDFVLTSATPSG
jgi:hypothetical protein